MRKKFVYFGTPYVAKDTLAFLVEHGVVPSLVVTSPDAPRGRGQKLAPSLTKEWALLHGLPVFAPEKLTPEAVEEVAKVGADYGIVVAYGKILPETLISVFPMGLLNIHYSLLPKYRGASPVETVLLAGETTTGVTIQKLVKELDAGDILSTKEVAVGENETTRELRPRLVKEGAKLLVDILPSFEKGELLAVPQDHKSATRCGKIAKEKGFLDLDGDAKVNWNKYRAFAESPGTYFFMDKDGKNLRVKIKTAKYENNRFVPLRVVPEGKNETDYGTLFA